MKLGRPAKKNILEFKNESGRSYWKILISPTVERRTLFSLIMAEDLIGLDILPRMTVMRPDFGLRFFLRPLLHTTLVNDIREKSKLG